MFSFLSFLTPPPAHPENSSVPLPIPFFSPFFLIVLCLPQNMIHPFKGETLMYYDKCIHVTTTTINIKGSVTQENSLVPLLSPFLPSSPIHWAPKNYSSQISTLILEAHIMESCHIYPFPSDFSSWTNLRFIYMLCVPNLFLFCG